LGVILTPKIVTPPRGVILTLLWELL